MLKRLKIALLYNAFHPYRQAIHRRLQSDLECDIYGILTHEWGAPRLGVPDLRAYGVELFGVGEDAANQGKLKYALREWRKGGAIISYLRNIEAQVVVVMGYNDLGRLRVINWCKRAGIACFLFGDCNIRCDRVFGLRWLVKFILFYWLRRRVSGFLACGEMGRRYFTKYGVSPKKIFYFPYEPDCDRFSRVEITKVQHVREKYDLNKGRYRFVFCGRFEQQKRVDLLIRAFLEIADRRPMWDVVLIGSGSQENVLRRMIPMHLRSRFVWPGLVSDLDELSALYHSCDVFVLPSAVEPWGVVVQEAAACGLALICSSVCGAGYELVQQGKNGWIFDNGNVFHLRDLLLEISSDFARLEVFKKESQLLLGKWRLSFDPVVGLRNALEKSGFTI